MLRRTKKTATEVRAGGREEETERQGTLTCKTAVSFAPVSPAQTILPSFNSGLPLAYQDTILLDLGVQIVPRMPVVADEQHRVSRTEDDSTILVGTRSSS